MTGDRLKWIALAAVCGFVAACGGGGDDAEEAARSEALAAAPAPAPPPGTNWVNCAAEGGVCAVPETRTVRYGGNGIYLYKSVTGSIGCNNAVWSDPLFGVVKACDYAGAAAAPPPPPPPADTQWTKCADENGVCTVSGTRAVRYGARGSYFSRNVTGSIACNNGVWGDPLVGVVKACEYAGTAAAPPPPPVSGGPLQGVPAAPVALQGTVGQTSIRNVALTNRGSAPLQLRIEGGDNASGVSTRAATLAAGASLELRAALACDKAQSRRVSYTLRTDNAAQPSATLAFDLTCVEPAVNYSGPLNITGGGTYSGNWQSSDPSVAAVSIRTTEPVVIENCHVRGPGNLIASRFSDSEAVTNVDVTIRNCKGIGTGGNDLPQGQGHFYVGVFPKRVVIENNTFADTSGIWIIGDARAGAIERLRVQGNRMRNITSGRNAVGLIDVNATPGLEIAWNEVVNEPFVSRQEDVILTYKVQGTAADPVRVHGNFIDGAYPRHPRTDPSTGSGINAGDGDTAAGNRFVHAYENHVVRAVNVGMFIAAGADNLLYGNRILSSGLLADGSRIDHRFTGMYVWDCCYSQVPSGIFRNNIARDNWVGHEAVDSAGNVRRLDNKLDNCATDAAGRSLCTGNTAPVGRITPAQEDAERGRWLDRVAARGLAIGPK
jgi:hypothetical protein